MIAGRCVSGLTIGHKPDKTFWVKLFGLEDFISDSWKTNTTETMVMFDSMRWTRTTSLNISVVVDEV